MNNCLSYWFPLLDQAGLPVPRTIIVRASREAHRDLYHLLDGRPVTDASLAFRNELAAAVGSTSRVVSGRDV